MNFITNKCECYWEEVDVIVVNLLATPRMYIQSHLQQRSWKSHLFRIGKLFSLLLCQKKKTCNGSHCVSAWLGHRTQANRNNSSECFPAASFGCEWDLQSGLSTKSWVGFIQSLENMNKRLTFLEQEGILQPRISHLIHLFLSLFLFLPHSIYTETSKSSWKQN